MDMSEEQRQQKGLLALLPASGQVCISFPASFHCLKTAALVEEAGPPGFLIFSNFHI